MQFTISLKTRFFLVVFSRWKRYKFQISIKFDFKNGKTYFESLISPSFDELHCSTIVPMNHMELMFQDLSFYCTKKVPKNHKQFFTFVTGLELTSWCLLRPWCRIGTMRDGGTSKNIFLKSKKIIIFCFRSVYLCSNSEGK